MIGINIHLGRYRVYMNGIFVRGSSDGFIVDIDKSRKVSLYLRIVFECV